MKKVVSILVKLLIFLTLSVVVFLYGSYYYGLHPVKEYLVPSQTQYKQEIKEVLWASYSGGAQIEQDRTSPIEFIIEFIGLSLSNDIGPWYERIGAAQYINSFAVRSELLDKSKEEKFDWHLANIAGSIWISKNFTIDESMATVLDDEYFGLWPDKGIKRASRNYYGVDSDSLTIDQVVRLIATLRNPSKTQPHCFIFQGEKGEVKRIVSRLKENWPDKYKDYVYQEPPLADRNFPKCKFSSKRHRVSAFARNA